MSKYSEKEWELISHYGYNRVAEHMDPIIVYRAIAIDIFVDGGCYDEYAESVRRCIIALQSGTARQNTSEFDDLIVV